ncbi:MAG: hypothetical protein H6Q33_2644 [Deltaproteobacteria bacterium]|nr:hypothetical protein [Deltaproteobacteria bacterium]
MDPSIIVFGIRTLLRLRREGIAAVKQYERDKAVLFPDAISADFRDIDFIRDTFFPDHSDLITAGGALAKFWHGTRPAPVPGALEALYMTAVQLRADDAAKKHEASAERGIEVGGALMIQQWADGKGPVGAMGRMVLSLTDIALEFVGANPSLLGIGGDGEKLVAALAANLSEMIPDDAEDFGGKSQLAERFVGIMLRAGLKTLNDQPDWVVRTTDLQQLVKHTLPPLIAALPEKLSEQSQWRDVADALLGPAASAAMATVAANPSAFLGATFDPHRAMGALTQAMLREACRTGLKQQFTETGFVALYTATLGVAAERPELFVGRPGTPTEQLAVDLFGDVAGALKASPPPFDKDLGAHLAVAVLDAVKDNGLNFLDASAPWESAVGAMALQVVDGLKVALTDPATGGIKSVFTQRQLLEFARIFLAQAAKTPAMIAGGNMELQAIVGGVAAAMSQDKDLLLTPDDWLTIAAVAAEEGAANPQRLFPTAAGSLGVGAELLKDLLAVATAECGGGRNAGGVLFGATLREAMVLALRTAAGNVKAAAEYQAALKDLAKTLSEFVRGHPNQYGSEQWLVLYRHLIPRVLQGGAMGTLTKRQINTILGRGAST